MVQKLSPGYFLGAKAGQMGRVLLAIDPFNALGSAQSHKASQRHLGTIGLEAEHGFAKNRLADCHAIKPTDQLVAKPSLHAVRMPLVVKVGVGLDHLLDYPCA